MHNIWSRFRPTPVLSALLVGWAAFYPNRAEAIPLPRIPSAVFNITHYGAIPDGKTLNTAAIQKTIDTCAAAGGGMVEVPAGKFLFGPIRLTSRINLHLDQDAELLLSDDLANYPANHKRYADGITATNAHDLAITGPGIIDGQGAAWWHAFKANPNMTHRPYLTKLTGCTRLLVSGVTLQNSPMFHLVTQNCTDVTIEKIHISAPEHAANTDGIDPSGWNFLIRDCHIDTGDDNIAIKPGSGRVPGDKNFTVRNCTFVHGHGMSVGGGTLNGLKNLLVENCTFADTDSAIRIKTPRGNGGLLEDAVYQNITIDHVKNPIYINDYYPERTAPADPATETAQPVTDRTPRNQNITFRNITITNCPNAGTIQGLPEAPMQNLTFIHVNISATSGMKIYHARNVRFRNSDITVEQGQPLITYDAEVRGLK